MTGITYSCKLKLNNNNVKADVSRESQNLAAGFADDIVGKPKPTEATTLKIGPEDKLRINFNALPAASTKPYSAFTAEMSGRADDTILNIGKFNGHIRDLESPELRAKLPKNPVLFELNTKKPGEMRYILDTDGDGKADASMLKQTVSKPPAEGKLFGENYTVYTIDGNNDKKPDAIIRGASLVK